MTDMVKPIIFDGENYDEWESSMLFHLRSKLLSRSLTERRPTDTTQQVEWDRIDTQALGKIGERVSPKFHEYIRSANSAKEAWDQIKEIAQLNATNMMIRARRELTTLKMADKDDMYLHLSTMERCRRILKGTDAPVTDAEMIIRVMDSLPSSWTIYLQGIRTQRSLMTKYEEFRNELLAEATYRKTNLLTQESIDSSIALQTSKFKGTCNNCKKPGHKKADCWAKGGGKEGQGPRNRNLQAAKANRDTKRYNLVVVKNKPTIGKANKVTAYNNDKGQWILDSGATDHMTGIKNNLYDIEEYHQGVITVANGQQLNAIGRGKLLVKTDSYETSLSDVLWIPGLSVNLVSVSALAKRGATTRFHENTAKVYKEHEIVLTATRNQDGLYVIDCSAGQANAIISKVTICDLHRRMGHLHEDALRKLPAMVEGLEISNDKFNDCTTCNVTKATRESFHTKKYTNTKPGEELYADLTFINKTPVLIVSDKGSGSTFHKVLHAKSDAENEIVNIVKAIEVQYEKQVKCILSDNGGEFISERLKNWAKRVGIHLITTSPYTPEQNGIAERKNRTIIEMCRSLLADSGLERNKYWQYALATAVYIRNRSPTRASKYEKTPFEIMTGRKPNLLYLRRFGEKGYYYIQKNKRGKLDNKAKECRLLGYEEKCYILLDIESGKIIRSAHVKFPQETEQLNQEESEAEESNSEDDEKPDIPEMREQEHAIPEMGEQEYAITNQNNEQIRNTSRIPISQRVTKVLEPVNKRAPKDIISNVDTSNIIEGRRRKTALLVIESKEPKNYSEATTGKDREKWKEAIMSELESLEENKTWTIIKNEEVPPNTNLVDTKWIFKKKRDATGKLEKYKGRLCARGFLQNKGEDYDETFAPVVRISTIRLLLALSINLKHKITQMDIVTAYLYSKLDKAIYMKPPEGMELLEKDLNLSNYTLALEKGIYGLKQAGYLWNQEIKNTLLEIGLYQSTYDPGLYYKVENNQFMFVTVYVDDILISTANEQWRSHFENELSKKYKTKVLGEINSILGAIVKCNAENNKATIQQTNYVAELGEKYKVQDMAQQMIPIEGGVKLKKGVNGETIDDYRKALGSIMYISLVSRPDIAYAVNYLGRFSGCCDQEHWRVLKGLLNYVYNTKDAKLEFKATDNNDIKLYVDASHINEDSFGVTGYIIYFADNPIIWKSKKTKSSRIIQYGGRNNSIK